ncbi:hypothetical protein L486_01984 [Kwoniella mangroviensis CBS 10435]|uniref:Uncharacterized protein n=1 Tax=Kwoniella mangroviensis CBS 10435 TaxID=1331196 RepID=A0A1B9J3F3_9TREE|nr:uncharacterized protein I203_06484 [Kwoniella mangroviensis CBS 8507]OCF62316.1 hypothetical protein L486_01984 [Kwoniella mangroviensis CBS 10435]OCF64303.1 hypothetical protein I203_06484 [Kwoniella mangroviensis CBS 8507]OCF73118.1 hypothetical protein I204_06348 [Kwoniella mangroviensis CBS 8886]
MSTGGAPTEISITETPSLIASLDPGTVSRMLKALDTERSLNASILSAATDDDRTSRENAMKPVRGALNKYLTEMGTDNESVNKSALDTEVNKVKETYDV